MRLSDTIEGFIKEMLEGAQDGVELKRNELAEYFHCAPSQINYVLATRFSQDHGYVIESRRGGGGCIRIVHVVTDGGDRLDYLIRERIGDSLDAQSAQRICRQLLDSGVISAQDAELALSAVSPQALSVPAPESVKNALRAKIMRSMLLCLTRREARERKAIINMDTINHGGF